MSEYREILVQERVTALQKEIAAEIVSRLAMVDLTDLPHGVSPPDMDGCLAGVMRNLTREGGPLSRQEGVLRRVAEKQLLREAFGESAGRRVVARLPAARGGRGEGVVSTLHRKEDYGAIAEK